MTANSAPPAQASSPLSPRGSRIPPGPLAGAWKQEEATLKDVPDSNSLAAWLGEYGVDTSKWGEGNTKAVSKFWKELKQNEAGLELWRKEDGSVQPVRVTHVLRAKVCSARSYERGIFLFNTWQQFADGRKRTRNGLLSEKLSTAEVPIEEHLEDICRRAVLEEMQQVMEASFIIGLGISPPEHDPSYKCPIQVERAQLIDYTIEVELSKSFPGLLTMYHLYTVDIICNGLPGVDFNTLEYDEPGKDGKRKLKYVHAWNWLNWSTIQRYLFEGSKRKETRKKGSFTDENELADWLSQHGVDLSLWAKDGHRSTKDLLDELEREEAQLELWGRHDGVSLLMRVVHVLQLQVISTDSRLEGKFLFNTWQQGRDGRCRTINRLMSRKLSTDKMPFTEENFNGAVDEAVNAQLSYLMDVHFKMHPPKEPQANKLVRSGVIPTDLRFVDHHFDIEESTTFKGLRTMYHMYSMELQCDGLPHADFTSLDFSKSSGPKVNGWRWVTWPEILDTLHARTQVLERQEAVRMKSLLAHRHRLEGRTQTIAKLLEKSIDTGSAKQNAEEVCRLLEILQSEMQHLSSVTENGVQAASDEDTVAKMLPPSMVSEMASDTITSSTFLEEAHFRRIHSGASRMDLAHYPSSVPVSPTPSLQPVELRLHRTLNLQLQNTQWEPGPWCQKLESERRRPKRPLLVTALGLGVCTLQVAAGTSLLQTVSSRRGQVCIHTIIWGALGLSCALVLEAAHTSFSKKRSRREEVYRQSDDVTGMP